MNFLFFSAFCLAAKWTTNPHFLLKDGVPIKIRGFSYEPTIPSHDPSSSSALDRAYQPQYAAIFAADFKQMKAAGANTVKIYGDAALNLDGVMTVLDEASRAGLNVILTHWMASYVYPCSMLLGPEGPRQYIYEKAMVNVRAMAQAFGNHPALLGYVLGNELNAGNGPATPGYGNCVNQVYLLIGEMAKEIKKIDPNHLITTAFEIGTSNKPGAIPATTLIAQASVNGLSNLDFWGMDLYRNGGTEANPACDFNYGNRYLQQLIQINQNTLQKPLVLLEYGADRFNMLTFKEWPNYQAVCDGQLAQQLEGCMATHTCGGGLVFAWVDEWWKSKFSPDPAQFDCPTSVLDHQTFCGFQVDASPGFPDNFFNEEYFGVNSIVLNSTGLYCRRAEPAMETLAGVWGGSAAAGVVTCNPVRDRKSVV